MGFENNETITLLSGAALSQFRFVSVDSTGRAVQTGAGAEAHGVSCDSAAAAAEAITVALFQGKMQVEAGEAIGLGDNISSDSTGRAATTATTQSILGVALSIAGAAGEMVEILLTKAGDTPA